MAARERHRPQAERRRRPGTGRGQGAGSLLPGARLTLGSLFALGALLVATPALAEGWIHDVPAPADGALVVLLEHGLLEVAPRPGSDRIRIEASARGLGASSVEFHLTRVQVAGRSELHFASSEEEWLRWLSLPPRVQVKVYVPSHVAVALISKGRRTEVVTRGLATGRNRPDEPVEFTRPVSLSVSRTAGAQNGVGLPPIRLRPAIHQSPASR